MGRLWPPLAAPVPGVLGQSAGGDLLLGRLSHPASLLLTLRAADSQSNAPDWDSDQCKVR